MLSGMQQQEVYFGRPALRLASQATSPLAQLDGLAALRALSRATPRLALCLLRLRADGALEELPLNEAPRHAPTDGARRAEHIRELLHQAASSQRLCVGQFRGFSDFAYALGEDASGQLFLYGDDFVLEPFDWNALLSLWRERSGLSASSAEPAFVRFVSAALERPVLGTEALERLRRLCAASSPTWQSLCLSPQNALALSVLPPCAPESHPLKLKVEIYRAQQACRELVEKWLSAVETRGDDGCLLFYLPHAATRAELEPRVAELSAMLQRRFGMRVALGVGRDGGDEPATRHALAALQRALHQGAELSFCDDAEPAAPGPRYSELTRAVDRLIVAFERVALGEAMIAADELVRVLSSWANGRPGSIRDQLLVALSAVAKAVARRNLLSAEVSDHFIDDACQRLEKAGGVPHLIEEFKQGLLRLALFSTDGPGGLHCMRLDKTLEYLKEHCAESLRLPRVARRAGFSVPTFSRAFKRATGTSFARYVRSLRVARAGELLKTTNLSGERIAELCGFRNQHHLIRSFKQLTGQTPGAFREEAMRESRC